MVKTPEPTKAQITYASVAEPVSAAEAGVAPVAVEGPQATGNEPQASDTRAELAKLFEHLKIVKIIFVDDKAELQTDAGDVIKALVERPAANKSLANFFPGVSLTVENDALQEQVAARLAELDADGLSKLCRVLSAQSYDAAEREVLGRLRDLLPDEMPVHLLTPQAWHDRRDGLIDECKEDSRTLFLFDQELEVYDHALDFTKGSDIIRQMAEKEKEGFGARWFCGMLTHTVEVGDEVSSWQGLAESERLNLRFFMPISKSTLDDAPSFYWAVYRTLINTYCQTMKNLAADAFEQALKDALNRFSDLDPIDFEHVVVKSSEEEGVSELETLIRLYGIIQKDQVKAQILQQARVGEFSIAARTVKGIADIERALPAISQERLHKLRQEELYEGDQFVNSYNDPLRNGDIFEIGEGDNLKLWVLIAQPCDLMVRKDGKRSHEENFKVAVLAPLRTMTLGEKANTKGRFSFSLEHYDHDGAQSTIVKFADATPANLQVLDLAVFNKDGRCQLTADPDPNLSLPSRAWDNRDNKLREYFKKVTKRIEDAQKNHGDLVAGLLATAILPRASPNKAFAKYGSCDQAGTFTYPIRRCGRIREPLASSLLSAYSRFLARDAYEHDYSRA